MQQVYPDGLQEAKEIVRLFMEKSGNTTAFVAGVIMIAPMFCKSFEVVEIVKATGFTQNQVERVAVNLLRFDIWSDGGCWNAEWGKIFAEWDEVTEDELGVLQMAFICDCLVGEGAVSRQVNAQGEFMYKAINRRPGKRMR